MIAPDEFANNIRHHFGYNSFHPLQLDIVNHLVSRERDVCAILAPGFGRSLCYQYPAIENGLVLVVSPLTDSIYEQTRFLNVCIRFVFFFFHTLLDIQLLQICGISTCILGIDDQVDFLVTIPQICKKAFKMVYVIPEFVFDFSDGT